MYTLGGGFFVLLGVFFLFLKYGLSGVDKGVLS